MGELGGISGREAVKRFTRLGYVVVRQRGSHVRPRHPLNGYRHPLTIPLHRELKIGLLLRLIQDAGIDVDTFVNV